MADSPFHRFLPLKETHLRLQAKMVSFHDWQMPLHYGSPAAEQQAVRSGCGLFDVSHMQVIEVQGPQSVPYLQQLLAADAGALQEGRGGYSVMLNGHGCIMDDLICYRVSAGRFVLVVNCATAERDLALMRSGATGFAVQVHHRPERVILALQGPGAHKLIRCLFAPDAGRLVENLKPFAVFDQEDLLVARTGYTGEDGFEMILPVARAAGFWNKLTDAGAVPCGLAARDTLRLEAGLNLYGAEMDDTVRPAEANVMWSVAMEPAGRNFTGRDALERTAGQERFCLKGLIMQARGVLRAGQRVSLSGGAQGVITSGTFSAFLGHAIALARLPAGAPAAGATVTIRGKTLPVTVGSCRFVRRGNPVFKPEQSAH